MRDYNLENRLIHELKGVIHNKILLYDSNYQRHIKVRHSEITLDIIELVLEDPDFVYKPSKRSEDFYYEKNINGKDFRVIVGKYRKGIKNVITAYEVDLVGKFSAKHIFCSYDREEAMENTKRNNSSDMNYFKEIFNVSN